MNSLRDRLIEKLMPALEPSLAGLKTSLSAAQQIKVCAGPPISDGSEIDVATAMLKGLQQRMQPVGSCQQILWISVFFDGTGNNLDADIDTQKHSNVAKLYRAHRGDHNIGGRSSAGESRESGIYRIYVPGVGTYFQEIGDSGSNLGNAFGLFGERRIKWAIDQIHAIVRTHKQRVASAQSELDEVNISVFGFSRGAALARAFSHDLTRNWCRETMPQVFRLNAGGCRLRIRFMGLFDTVASSGLASSGNNLGFADAAIGNVESHLKRRGLEYGATLPAALAFANGGEPGANPSPGIFDGHRAFGGRLDIPHMVEDVRHFIAGHENRNSFPVDSVATLVRGGSYATPDHFFEYVYPGVHSDVGGSYRPGEGGKNQEPFTKLGLIPLHAMLKFARQAGVPMVARLQGQLATDFSIDPQLNDDYAYYLSKLGKVENKLGSVMNASMSLYFQWRFHAIRKRLDPAQANYKKLGVNARRFAEESISLDNKIALAESEYEQAAALVKRAEYQAAYSATHDFYTAEGRKRISAKNNENVAAKERMKILYDRLYRLKARRAAQPDDSKLAEITNFYDKQLLKDAKSIREFMSNKTRAHDFAHGFVIDRSALRPHYRALIEAYETEFIHRKPTTDLRIIEFFEKYVHDSLAGFAKDATFPSDPRVIYTGGDNRLPYASVQDHLRSQELDDELLA